MTAYYGVLGNRDHIKIQGERVPYWRFLDSQPDGWLSSLVYLKNTVFPTSEHHRILDCGAWSYKHEDVPRIGKTLVSAETVVKLYAPYARSGDFVLAPDHMLIEGCDVETRERFNAASAIRFLDVAPSSWVPMACIHGRTIDERIDHARWLAGLGYRHLAVGGVAARASQKALVLQIVGALHRALTSDAGTIWLHVMGLSSPAYFLAWNELGVQSCDGSSHFKQAFTGGVFYTCDEHGRLHKHDAAHTTDEPVTAPECDCTACTILRAEGIDTRRFGSNEHNMGRAVHNQNMLMRAHRIVLAPGEWGLR